MASLMSPHSWRKLGTEPCRQCGKAVGTSGEPGFCSVKCRLDMVADNRNKRDLRLQTEAKAEADRLAAARAAQRAADEEAERQNMTETERAQRIVEAIGVVCKVCTEVRVTTEADHCTGLAALSNQIALRFNRRVSTAHMTSLAGSQEPGLQRCAIYALVCCASTAQKAATRSRTTARTTWSLR